MLTYILITAGIASVCYCLGFLTAGLFHTAKRADEALLITLPEEP